MNRIVRVVITDEDIKEGTPALINTPIALAVRRAFDKNEINGTVAFWPFVPQIALDWMTDWELGKPVDPIEFDLELPPLELRDPNMMTWKRSYGQL